MCSTKNLGQRPEPTKITWRLEGKSVSFSSVMFRPCVQQLLARQQVHNRKLKPQIDDMKITPHQAFCVSFQHEVYLSVQLHCMVATFLKVLLFFSIYTWNISPPCTRLQVERCWPAPRFSELVKCLEHPVNSLSCTMDATAQIVFPWTEQKPAR